LVPLFSREVNVTVTLACDNPKCICDPCSCEECKCAGPKLGDLERKVMDVVWERTGSELTGRDVVDALPEYAYTTLATILDRLSKKGYLRRRTDQRVVRYTAADSQDEHTAAAMRDLLSKATDSKAVLIRFARTVSRSDAEVLRQELREAGGTRSSRKRP
jgi:predicted transcriptional regulator